MARKNVSAVSSAVVVYRKPVNEEVFFVNTDSTVYPTRNGKAAMQMLISLTNMGIRASVRSLYLPLYV